MAENGWVGFDLDGTLAEYDTWRGAHHIGKPIEPIAVILRDFLKRGVEVRILTARACEPADIPPVEDWCEKHFGVRLKVTNQKDYSMWMCFDDRAIAVEKNTGHIRYFPELWQRVQ